VSGKRDMLQLVITLLRYVVAKFCVWVTVLMLGLPLDKDDRRWSPWGYTFLLEHHFNIVITHYICCWYVQICVGGATVLGLASP
jgi:hypothetical protein